MRIKVNDTPNVNTDDAHEVEIYKVVTKYLWQAFETSAPDTPQRIFRVVLFALRQNGYCIVKEEGGRPLMRIHE